MKRSMYPVLVLSILAVLVISPLSVQADPDEVQILVWFPDTYTVQSDQEVILYGRWGACSPGLVQMFRTASNVQLTLDGFPILGSEDVRELWGQPESSEPWEWCMGNQDLWWAFWYYSLGTLEPGTHELVTTLTLNHQVHDGADYDGDGVPDMYPADWFWQPLITIIVE